MYRSGPQFEGQIGENPDLHIIRNYTYSQIKVNQKQPVIRDNIFKTNSKWSHPVDYSHFFRHIIANKKMWLFWNIPLSGR